MKKQELTLYKDVKTNHRLTSIGLNEDLVKRYEGIFFKNRIRLLNLHQKTQEENAELNVYLEAIKFFGDPITPEENFLVGYFLGRIKQEFVETRAKLEAIKNQLTLNQLK